MSAFFVYVDRTDDGRPFYVGKGNAGRVRHRKRNPLHANISRKHGCHREVVLATSVEAIALDHERELVAGLRTQHGVEGHWGANLTAGGEGLSNPSPEIRKKMGESQRRRPPPSEETRRRLSEASRRLNTSPEHRARQSALMKGRPRSVEYCANIARAKKKPVLQLNIDGMVIARFDSALEAQQATGISRTKICLCCKGKRRHTGGYRWSYGDPQ